ncbi:MAG: hypothetical protein M3Q74_13190, partial [Pseudomonadota bacterium]|nr:hypothetical protein [Pseudomonadota bacterium]
LLFHMGSATAAASIWTNMPLAVTELFGGGGGRDFRIDLARYTEVRMFAVILTTFGTAAAELRPEYLSGATWIDLAATAGAADLTIASPGVTKLGTWTPIVASLGERYLRVAGLGGDGIVDPAFNTVQFQLR